MQEEQVLYKGGCHCQAVEFEALGPKELVVWICNCSICQMKQNHHFIIPQKDFKLVKGKDFLTLYQFNQKIAKHYFCKICGISAFYYPRSNPDGVAITYNCVKNKELCNSVKYEKFDGIHWEETIQKVDIKKYSEI